MVIVVMGVVVVGDSGDGGVCGGNGDVDSGLRLW